MPKPVPIKKIVVKRKYFPRFKVKKSRVEQFRQSMRDGEHIPPILVGKDNGRYVVIEGAHRFAAAKLERVKCIPVLFWSNPDKDAWLLDAARLNDKTTDPLTTKELEEVVRRKWQEGWRDTKKIAKLVGRNIQFVQRTLKPICDEERNMRNAWIRDLANKEGYTQKEIAQKVGISRQAISKILMQPNQTLMFGCNVNKSKQLNSPNPPQKLNINLEMLSDDNQESVDIESPEELIEPSPDTPDTQDATDTPEPVIPTELIDKIKAKAQSDTAEPSQRRWRRHLKETPVHDIAAVYRDAKILRGWITDIKMGSYDKTTVDMMHECARKLIICGNELHRTIRDFWEAFERESDRMGMAQGIDSDHQEEKIAVDKFMARKWSRIQGLPEEDRQDLRMELYLAAMESRQKWDGKKSSIETWLANNVEWKYSKLAEKEYKRRNTLAEYRNAVEHTYSAGSTGR